MCLSPDFKPAPDYRLVVQTGRQSSGITRLWVDALICFRPIRRLRWRLRLELQKDPRPRKNRFFNGWSYSTVGPIHRTRLRLWGFWQVELEAQFADPFHGRWPEFAPRWMWPEYWKGK